MYTRVFLFASLLASIAVAVSIPGLPKCAGDCVPADFGGCQQLNVQCICSNTKLLTNLSCCVSKNCSKADQDKTIQFANSICKGEHVTNLPQTATCASTAAGSSSTAASNGTMTSGTGAMTSGTGTITSGTSSQSTTNSPAAPQSSSSQAAAAGYEKAGGVGLGMVFAGLVAAL